MAYRNGNKPTDQYWAAVDTEEIGNQLSRQIEQFYEFALTSGRMNLWRESHRAYNNALEFGVELGVAGETGELADLRINNVRNLQTSLVNLTLASRPSWQPRAINSDYKSQAQTLLARNILDYEMSERELEKRFRSVCDFSMTYGDAAIVVMWDETSGEDAT